MQTPQYVSDTKKPGSSFKRAVLYSVAILFAANVLVLTVGLLSSNVSALSYKVQEEKHSVRNNVSIDVSEEFADQHEDVEPGIHALHEIRREDESHTATGYIFRNDGGWLGRATDIIISANDLSDPTFEKNADGDPPSKIDGATIENSSAFQDTIDNDPIHNAEFAYFYDQQRETPTPWVAQRLDITSDDLNDRYAFNVGEDGEPISQQGNYSNLCSDLEGEDTLYFYKIPCAQLDPQERIAVTRDNPGSGDLHVKEEPNDQDNKTWEKDRENIDIARPWILANNIDGVEETSEETKEETDEASERGGEDPVDHGEGDVVDPPEEDGSSQGQGEEEVQCKDNVDGFLPWMVCEFITWSIGVIEAAETFIINGLLDTEPISLDTDNPLYQIWNSFRIFANSLFVIAFLIIIFSQATSLNIDAYSVKRMLPRLLIAVVMVQLSYFASALVIDGVHILGNGLDNLVDDVLSNAVLDLGAYEVAEALVGAGGLAYGAGVAAASISLSAVMGTLAPILMFGLLALIAVLVVIALREIFILMAVVLSPIAFVAYLLPSTEKWFKFWWSNFTRLLLMYPFMILMIQVGKIGAYISLADGGFLSVIMAFIMQLAAIFLIVFAFKISGTAMLAVSNLMSKGRKVGQKQTQKSLEKRRSLADERKANVAEGLGVNYEGERGAGAKNQILGRLSQRKAMRNKASGASKFGWGGVGDRRYNQSKAQRRVSELTAEANKQGEEDLQRHQLDDTSGTKMMLEGYEGYYDENTGETKGFQGLYEKARQNNNQAEMNRLQKQWQSAQYYRTTGAGRAAAIKNAGKVPGVKGESVYRAAKDYYGNSGVGAKAFSDYGMEAKDKNPQEMLRDYNTGQIDNKEVAKEVSKKPPEDLSKLSNDAWEHAIEGFKDPQTPPGDKIPDETLHTIAGGGDKPPMVSAQNASRIRGYLQYNQYLDSQGNPRKGPPTHNVNVEQMAGQPVNPPDQGDVPVREQGQTGQGGQQQGNPPGQGQPPGQQPNQPHDPHDPNNTNTT